MDMGEIKRKWKEGRREGGRGIKTKSVTHVCCKHIIQMMLSMTEEEQSKNTQ